VKDLAIKALVPASGATLAVTSPAFKDNADIPYENTQYRGNIFPGLSWTPGPAGTKSYAVFVQGQPKPAQAAEQAFTSSSTTFPPQLPRSNRA